MQLQQPSYMRLIALVAAAALRHTTTLSPQHLRPRTVQLDDAWSVTVYEAKDIDGARLENLLSLFRLEFKDPSLMKAEIAGRPVYLALCKSDDGRVRMKPQNLAMNLPLAPTS